MNDRSSLWLWAGCALLVANSAYLSMAGDPGVFYLGNLLLHLLLGFVLLPFALSWWRRRRPRATLGVLLLAGSAAAGVLLLVLGNRSALRPLLWSHVGLAVAGLVALLWALAGGPRRTLWKVSVAGLAAALLLPVVLRLRQTGAQEGAAAFANPPAPASLAEQAMGGAEGPFYPSALSTPGGGLLPAEAFTQTESCGRAGCHPDVAAQWSSSAHRFSGLDNPWYRKTYEQMREDRGEVAARWCGGCHTPALLVSGMMDFPTAEVAGTPAAEAGVSCTVCHRISQVRSSLGQADFELAAAPLHAMAESPNRFARMLHDFLIRVDPEPHRRTYSKPLYSTSEFCAPCHNAFLDKPLNDHGYLAIMDDYEIWQFYSSSGESIGLSMHYPEPQSCIDCHMPEVASEDAGHGDGKVRSHRFAAANTALPALNGDQEQLAAVIDFLQDEQITLDIFAMSPGRPIDAADTAKRRRERKVYAPLDRLPATLRRGESNRFDVLVRTRGVGHQFPGGKLVFHDCWLELKAVDDRGRTVFWNGRTDADGKVEGGTHFITTLGIDEDGRGVEDYRFWERRARVYAQDIEPHVGYLVRFRVEVPADAGEELTLTARLNYRKFRPEFTRKVFAEVGSEPPEVPVVTMAETSITLPVVAAGAELPDMEKAATVAEVDFERWGDYGYALVNSGNFRGGRAALETALELEPDFTEGWTMLGNLEWVAGHADAARAALGRALAIDPDEMRARYFLALVEMDDNKYERVVEYLSEVAERYPRDRLVWRELGRALFQNAEYEKAADALDKSLAVSWTNAGNHLMQALAHRALGRPELSERSKLLYDRFIRDPLDQEIVASYLRSDPHANAERQPLHEHESLPLDESAPEEPGGVP